MFQDRVPKMDSGNGSRAEHIRGRLLICGLLAIGPVGPRRLVRNNASKRSADLQSAAVSDLPRKAPIRGTAALGRSKGGDMMAS